RESLGRVEIRAPATGYVLGLTTLAPGSVIKPGETIFEIVPADQHLIVRAKVHPDEIESLHPGMSANVRFTAYPVRTTPIATGEVRHVSADILTEERTGMPYFE